MADEPRLYRMIGCAPTYTKGAAPKIKNYSARRILQPLADLYPEVWPMPKEGFTLDFILSLPASNCAKMRGTKGDKT